jgi:hypothetical protein
MVERLDDRAVPSLAPFLYGAALAARPALAAPGLTPHETAREQFSASYVGSVRFGPGRTTDQAAQAFFVGPMTATAFRHGNLVMAIYTPTDPTQPATGQVAMIVRNVANSGNELILDLRSDTPASVDAPPTRLTWTVDGASSGAFTNATGSGTVTIRYRRLTPFSVRHTRSGVATVGFHGLLNTTGLNNVLRF